MRVQVDIPDTVYNQAKSAAEGNGQTVDSFVAEAVKLYLADISQEDGFKLSKDQIAIIRKSQEEIKQGNFFTQEEVDADLAAHKEAWLRASSH